MRLTELVKIAGGALLLFMMYMAMTGQVDYFQTTDPVLRKIRDQLAVIHPRFENVHLNEGDKSYTINKKKVFICTKDKNGRYYNRNMLVYVTLHEYSHMLCDEIDHTPKFYDIFDDLLKRAADLGLYNPSVLPLENYCGHD